VDFDYLFVNLPSALGRTSAALVAVQWLTDSKKSRSYYSVKSRNLCKASASGHTRQMSASEGGGLMRPFSKKSGGVRCFIDKNCLQVNAGQNISVRCSQRLRAGGCAQS
jgi:hypothetical protein